MQTPPFSPVFQPYRHNHWIEGARALADRPSAQEAGLSFDDAYATVAQMEVRYGNATLFPSEVSGTNPPVSTLSLTEFFGMAEAIDVMIAHGAKDQRVQAATFAAELSDIMAQSTEPGTKSSILANLLGIEVPPIDVPVSQQLVEQRLLPTGTVAERVALIGLIESRKRTNEIYR